MECLRNKKKENRLILCLNSMEKYEKVENVNAQNDYKIKSKK